MGLGLPGARVSAAAVAAAPTSGAVRRALGSVAAAVVVGWCPGLSCTYRWLKKPETRSITWEI